MTSRKTSAQTGEWPFKKRTTLLQRALRFATKKHTGQIRKGDGQPYIVHPIGVAKFLEQAGCDEETLAAGLLHDTVEDTATTLAELRENFGERVALLVSCVTEPDQSHTWEERKSAYLRQLQSAPLEALAISAADKLHNARSFAAAYRKDGEVVFSRFSRGPEQKRAQERKVLALIQDRWPDCSLLEPLEKALNELECL